MKWTKRYMILAGCLVFITGCSDKIVGTEQSLQVQSSGEIIASRESRIQESTTSYQSQISTATSSENQNSATVLTKENIDDICDKLYHTVLNCNDGSQVIVTGIGNNHIYFNYMPWKREDGNYEFFSHFHPAYDVTYSGEQTVTIPIHINNSDQARFLLNVDYSIEDDAIHIEQSEFTFLNQKDQEFHQMYEALDSMAQMEYRLSLVPDENLPKDQLAGFFRACIYNGNLAMIDRLYEVKSGTTPEDLELRQKLELAGVNDGDSERSFSDINRYRPEIYYGESCRNFPQQETLEFLAKMKQNGSDLEEMGAERLEPNMEWEEVYQIPSLKKLYQYLHESEQVTGIYRYDLDQDGLPEILILFPGGSMGNYFWEVLHLDESGVITHTNSGEGMGDAVLYRYHGNYFFLSGIIDFYDKELLGWTVSALNQSGQMYQMNITLEKVGVETVFTDEYIDLEEYYYLDWKMDQYIDEYKRYETTVFGREIEAGEEVQTMFHTMETPRGTYGTMDVNNDGIDDWTNVYKFETSTRYPYYCSYLFADGKTGKLFDFAKFETLSYNLRSVFPCTIGNKNYFVCLLNGYGNYVFKLIEIQEMEPVEIKSWFATVKNRVMVQVYEQTGARIGI